MGGAIECTHPWSPSSPKPRGRKSATIDWARYVGVVEWSDHRCGDDLVERHHGSRHRHVSRGGSEKQFGRWFCDFNQWILHSLVFTRLLSESSRRTHQWAQAVLHGSPTQVPRGELECIVAILCCVEIFMCVRFLWLWHIVVFHIQITSTL